MSKDQKKQAGKGDKARNCYSKDFINNYDKIDWKKSKNDNRRNA